MDGIQLISTELFQQVESEAREASRKRKNYNFHSGPEDNPHRMLNVLLRGTYVRPHRHVTPPKTEAFLPLTGRVGIICFDSDGGRTGHYLLDAAGPVRGIDLAPGLWHTVVALDDVSVCYEVKPGPWVLASDKDFAAWAPEECTAEAALLVQEWEALFAAPAED